MVGGLWALSPAWVCLQWRRGGHIRGMGMAFALCISDVHVVVGVIALREWQPPFA